MGTFIAGLVVFLGIHSLAIVAPGLRDRLAARLGEGPWKGLYALVSIAGFWLIISGWSEARAASDVLWLAPTWTKHLSATLLLPVFPLLLAAYLPGRIAAAARHPMLLATILWAAAHLITTLYTAKLILFGAFLVWAVADWASQAHRRPRAIPRLPASGVNDVVVVVAGLALYAGFAFWAHAAWIGVAPFGR
jgi:uncharacterized membrane protein